MTCCSLKCANIFSPVELFSAHLTLHNRVYCFQVAEQKNCLIILCLFSTESNMDLSSQMDIVFLYYNT